MGASDTATATIPAYRTLLLLLVGALFLLGHRLGEEPVDRSSERRCHEVAKTMVETGDYLVPMFDGAPRLQKPPLYYWLAAASAKVLGEVSLLSTRIPSMIAGLLLLAVVFTWSRALRDARFALLATALLLVTFQFGTSSRRGDAEMWLTLSSTAALACYERFYTTQKRNWLLLFGGAFAIALLSKATVAFVTVIVPILVFLARNRELSRFFRRDVLAVFGIAMVAGFSWYGVLLWKVDGAPGQLFGNLLLPFGVKVEAVKGDAPHYHAPWYFVTKWFSIAFPVALLLPLLLVHWKKTALLRADRAMQFVTLAVIAEFVVFSILPQKQKHYLLPLTPLFAIAAAQVLVAMSASPSIERGVRIGMRVLAIAGCGGAVALGAFASGFDSDHRTEAFVLLGAGFVSFALLAVLAMRSSKAGTIALFVAAEIFLMAYYHGRFGPWQSALGDAADGEYDWPMAKQALAEGSAHPDIARRFGLDDELKSLKKRLAQADAGR